MYMEVIYMDSLDLKTDIEIIMELLKLTNTVFSKKMNISRPTLDKWKNSSEAITKEKLEKIYNFAFESGIQLNQIKAQLDKEECPENSIVLFHGAKTNIDGTISLEKCEENNDFGKGFYCGESLEQSAMFVANYPNSSLYILQFEKSDLKFTEFNVDNNWMLLVAYFRKKLTEYEDHPVIKELLLKIKDVDYIIAPIADNRMFEIIDSFIEGEITDIQCQHCLSATNLGKQYVFVTENSIKNLEILRHCYLSASEKEFYLTSKRDSSKISNDKVKVARKAYRNQGKYIEEILV